MSMQKLTDATNSGYVSSEETDSLLVSQTPKCKSSVLRQLKMNSANGPTTNNMTSTASQKPTLMRQDRTSTYLTSPQLSQQTRLGSDDSDRDGSASCRAADEDVEQGLRTATVPDIEVYQEDQDYNQNQSNQTQNHQQQQHQLSSSAPTTSIQTQQHQQQQQHHQQPTTNKLQQQPTISITNLNNSYPDNNASTTTNMGTSSYQNLSSNPLSPSAQNRCRACRNCSRRASTTPISTTGHMDRSTSRDSVKSAFQQGNLGGSLVVYGGSNNALPHNVPPVLVTSSPTNGSRIIRQSSQPESSTSGVCCGAHSTCGHSHTVPNVSLKQLRSTETDGIAGIAADSLRINGGMRPFKQGVLLMPRTLSESRKLRLRRAFTEATHESLQCSKMVFKFC
ncbi:small conductance calcium-activated potassium channel protein-like [Musca vetustissima]|uniref:small conductance calcium-activated potassium channel protein-like n=1 Tax=Musca vetustissima TaxID=27455 RepID=UPI002AB6C616|nr:small conductance calcium-activated potassium channel protein-like [Musca vetustissima]